MNEIAALFLSFGFVFAIIGIASLLLSFNYVSGEVSRKLIHIGVSNWWLIAMNFMEHTYIAVIGPLSFIFINSVSYKLHLFPAMEDDVPRDNLGTIYFPISLLVLVLLCFGGYLPLAAGAAFIAAVSSGGLLLASAVQSLLVTENGLDLVPVIVTAVSLAVIVSVSGLLGSVLDSLLGASLQAKYLCSASGLHTERPLTDHRPNTLIKGYRQITNDTVNLLSVSTAAAVAGLMATALPLPSVPGLF